LKNNPNLERVILLKMSSTYSDVSLPIAQYVQNEINSTFDAVKYIDSDGKTEFYKKLNELHKEALKISGTKDFLETVAAKSAANVVKPLSQAEQKQRAAKLRAALKAQREQEDADRLAGVSIQNPVGNSATQPSVSNPSTQPNRFGKYHEIMEEAKRYLKEREEQMQKVKVKEKKIIFLM
jgi:hypothetical protein